MNKKYQIIFLNKQNNFNFSFNLNDYIIYLLIVLLILLISLSSWGIFRIVKPHKQQQYIHEALNLKYNTVKLLDDLINEGKVDSTILKKYQLNGEYNNLIPNNLPVKGIVTKGLAYSKNNEHNGIDIAAILNSNVKSAQEGFVVFADEIDHYGKTIIISHPNSYFTLYSHLSSIKVKSRDYVKVNQSIGSIGRSEKSDAPHLHFEIWKNHLIIDPRNLIKEYKNKDVSIEKN
tara:strand:- start:352 stop:1047 length:696 start_codon:yes stop_codon:yes gene_type:complete